MGTRLDPTICRTNLSQACIAWGLPAGKTALPYEVLQQLCQRGGLNLYVSRMYVTLVYHKCLSTNLFEYKLSFALD